MRTDYFKFLSDGYHVVVALFLVALVFVTACGGPTAGVPEEEGEKETATVPLTEAALKNAEYPSEWEDSGTITLTDGRYEGEPFVEGGTSRLIVTLVEPVAFGDLDGDGIDDAAVILAANPGGSGTFLSLEATGNEGGEPVHRATYPLGDRAQIESLAIESGQIVLEMVTHGPDDPMCCPTQRAEQTYVLQGDELMQTSSQVTSSDKVAGSDIVGIAWEWERFDDTAGEDDIVVDDPSKYTLELRPDDTYQVKADCNSSGGGYTLEGNSLTLQPGPTTLAECEPGSLYDVYLTRLGEVVTFARDGDRLVLNLKADAGNMVFTHAASDNG